MKLRVGLIGLGKAWEMRHRPALRALADKFEVRAVCDEVGMRAQRVAQEFDAEPIDGFRTMAARPDVDAILLLSPQWYGPLPILAACDQGKAVYCAVAMDISPEEARTIRNRVQQAGVAFMAEFPRRQSPATLRLKELIATQLGPVQLVFCHQRLVVGEATNGKVVRARTASPMVRELIELVDWCRYVVGYEPTSVIGVTHGGVARKDDYRMMSLDFSPGEIGSGPVAQISCGRYMPAKWQEAVSFRSPAGLQVVCENGVAFVDLPSNLVWFDAAGRHQESLDSERPVGEQMLSQFHRAVTSLVRKTDDLEDAYRALDIVLSARESSRNGHRVNLGSS
jgi:predicted dehydrogenase